MIRGERVSYSIRFHLEEAVSLYPATINKDKSSARLVSDLRKKAKKGYGPIVRGVARLPLPHREDVLQGLIAGAQDGSLDAAGSLCAAEQLLLNPVVLPLPDQAGPVSGVMVRQVALVRSVRMHGQIYVGIGVLEVRLDRGRFPAAAELTCRWYADAEDAADHLEELYLAETRRDGLPRGFSAWWVGGDNRHPEALRGWQTRIEAMGAVAGFDIVVLENPNDRFMLGKLRNNPPHALLEWKYHNGDRVNSLVEEYKRLRPGGHILVTAGPDFASALAEGRRMARSLAPIVLEPGDEAHDVLEAVKLAQERCKSLVFLDEALSSAADSNFPRPAEVLRLLEVANTVVEDWKAGRTRGGFEQAFVARGLSCYRSGIGELASAKYGKDYERLYEGKRIELGPHLAIGTTPLTGLRIYWWVDEARKVFVIGHIGVKLPDKSNP